MQKVFGAQGPHGVLTELNVTGGQELVLVAANVVALEASIALTSLAVA